MAFCKYCGRELKDGEICSCRKMQAPPPQRKKRKVVVEEDDYVPFDLDKEAIRRTKKRIYEAGSTAADLARKTAEWAERTAETGASAAEEAMSAPGGAYERHQPIVDQCIVPTEEEIPVRQYDIAVLRTIFPYKRAEGRLQVTNKRVIFRATGKSWLGTHFLENEFALSEIGGIELKKDHKINFWFLLLGALLGGVVMYPGYIFFNWLAYNNHRFFLFVFTLLAVAGGAALCVFKKKLYWLKMSIFGIAAVGFLWLYTYGENMLWMALYIAACVAVTIFLILFMITEDLIIKIKVSGASDVMEIRRQKKSLFFFVKEEYTGFSEVLPWKDAEIASRELGALINDVKLYGDAGIHKWQV